jgi:SUN domain-containing protein 1/2
MLNSHEQGLESISEHEEPEKLSSDPPRVQHSRRAFSAGGFLGRIVNLVLRLSASLFVFVLRTLAVTINIVRQALGGAFDALFSQPAHWMRRSNPALILKWLIVGAVLYTAFLGLRRVNITSYIPPLPSHNTRYEAPEVPAANIAEISTRLQALENALAGLSFDNEQSRARIDSQARGQSDVSGRLGALESRLQKESVRAAEDRNVDRVSSTQGLQAVRHEIDSLRSIVSAAAAQQSGRESNADPKSDEEARGKLAALEERVGHVEGGVREALELGKNSVKTGGAVAGAAWWNKITSSGKKALTIKASDGQDVTELIGHLVDTAVTRYSKDTIAKADFALSSSGASIIPSLTSETLEIVPQGMWQQAIATITGNGYAIGRPPITALHYETHNGHCWPFVGDQGQLGVLLALPVRIEEITIDHVARDVAWDMRSAPRMMEVWGFVEGAENLAKVTAWEVSRYEAGLEVPIQPRSLPSSAKYLRIAQFEYDIDEPNAVQTFPVDEDIRALGLDFGIVTLRMLSNWGREFTCLYRFRVHGQKLEEVEDKLGDEAETPA